MPNPLRIATFNLENLDDGGSEDVPLAERIPILRPQLIRLRADVIAFQEIHGQERPGEPRDVHAVRELLQGTGYETFHLASTQLLSGGGVYDKRNLVMVSRYPILENGQLRHDLMERPAYKR